LLRERIKPVTPGGGLFAVRRQRKNTGQLALEVDTQLAALGRQPDLVDQRADDVGGLGFGCIVSVR